MERIEDKYLAKLQNRLQALTTDYNIICVWNSYFDEGNNIDLEYPGKPEIKIIVVENPSQVYGSGNQTLSITCEALLPHGIVNDAMSIFKAFINQNYGVKSYLFNDTTYVCEYFQTPYVEDMNIETENGYSARIVFTGSVAFANGVVDVQKLEMWNGNQKEEIPFLTFHDYCTAESTTIATLSNERRKQVNKSSVYAMEVKVIAQDNKFCENARDFKYEIVSLNRSMRVVITFSDNKEITKDMIFDSVDFQTEKSGVMPVLVVTLREKL